MLQIKRFRDITTVVADTRTPTRELLNGLQS